MPAWPPSVSGVILDLEGPGGPKHRRLTQALRTAIQDGRLQPGETVPPSRALATDLGLSRWVVTEAYQQLTAEGYLEARRGSGTRVAAASAEASLPGGGGASDGPPAPSAVRYRIDLRPGTPDVSAFPRSDWLRAYTTASRSAASSELGHPDPAGLPRLRDTIARYLRRVRGIDARGEDVIITRGTTAAIGHIARALTAAGEELLAVEDPSWHQLPDVARRSGMRIAPVPVDDAGLVVHRMPSAARAVLVTPAHQFPVGVALSTARRRALLAWAAAHDGLIVEDDYDAEFRYDRRPVGAIAGVDRRRVAHVGSTSKTLVPGLRIGWLIPPPELRRSILATLLDGSGPTTFDQLAFAELIESGGYDRHLRRMRRRYRGRRDALLAALGAVAPALQVRGVAAGLHLLLQLPDRRVEREAITRLRAAGVGVIGLERYAHATEAAGLVLGYAQLSQGLATDAAAAIGRAVGMRPAP